MTFSSRIRAFAAPSAMAFAVVAMLVEPAFAQAAGIETILQNVVDLLQGNIFRL
ncbi:TrbC/VirB2 family protein, partial [Agrobacterium pusense]